MFELISMTLLSIGLLGCIWFGVRHRQYRMFLTAGFVAGGMSYGAVSWLHRQGRVGAAAVEQATWLMWTGFALQYVQMYLQLRDRYRKSVADYEARKLREPT